MYVSKIYKVYQNQVIFLNAIGFSTLNALYLSCLGKLLNQSQYQMEAQQKDICTLDDVKLLVDVFYGRIRANDLLGPIFNNIIGDNWQKHLQRMYDFWQTILLETPAYSGSPFLKHAKLPIAKEHFDTWTKLWFQTIDEHFIGEKANEAKWRAEKMSEMFQYKLDYHKNNSAQPLI